MSVSGISSSLSLNQNQPAYEKQPIPNLQEFKQDFQQLGQDLQSGNLSAARADFATLQKIGPKTISDPTLQPNNPLSQAFAQLSQDLQAGNLSGAKQDYAQIQQAFQHQAAQAGGHHHHHGGSQMQQLFQQLGQDLQSGDLSGAQQTFATLQQDLQTFASSGGQSSTAATGSTVSVSA